MLFPGTYARIIRVLPENFHKYLKLVEVGCRLHSLPSLGSFAYYHVLYDDLNFNSAKVSSSSLRFFVIGLFGTSVNEYC